MTRIVTGTDVSSFTTDAKFRTWGSAVSVALAASGLVQTADTGQINWTTVTKPTVIGTKAGYEIWRFNDSLQATAPIYLKLEYGSGSVASGNSPSTWLTAGTGSDGAGTITGLKIGPIPGPNSGAGSTGTTTNTSMAGLFTHTDGYVLMYQDQALTTETSNPMWWVVDRTRDQSTGASTSEGIHFLYVVVQSTSAAVAFKYHLNFTTGLFLAGGYNWTMPPGDSTSYSGSIFPVYTCAPRPLITVGSVGHMTADVANKATFTCKPIGTVTTRTYIALGNSLTYFSGYANEAVTGVANELNVKAAFLWED